MGDKKKKPSAKNLYKSSRDKLVKEFVENSYPDDMKSEQSTLRQGLKGNASKAIKKAIKSNKPEGSKLKKTPMQAALTGSPNKAVKEFIKDRFEKAQEAQKVLNKEYKKELGKLRRRISYFEGKGFQFDVDRIIPDFEGNATQEEIDYLKAIRGKVLKRMATGFEPPLVETDEVPVDEIVDTVNDDEVYTDLGEGSLSWEDTISDEHRDDVIPPIDEQTPQERYYSENEDREYDDNGSVERGRLILNNIYDDYNVGQPEKLSFLIDESPDLYNYKRGAATEFISMIEDAIDRLNETAVCMLIEEHAEEIKHSNQIIMYFIDSQDDDETINETEIALTDMQTIFEGDSPSLLMERVWGDPDNI